MSLLIQKKWRDKPIVEPVVLKEKVRPLPLLIDVEAERPFYSVLTDAVESQFVDHNSEESSWLKTLLGNFDHYMTRVIQATHFPLWDKEYNIRAEFGNVYPGKAKEMRELPIFTIVARLLRYNELMREIVHLREGPENRNGHCILDLDLYVLPPPNDPVPIWHSAPQVYTDSCRRGREVKHYWISFVEGQEEGKPVPYHLMTKDVWDALATGGQVPSFLQDFRIGTAYDDPAKYVRLHTQIQSAWTGFGGGAAIMQNAYREYIQDLDKAIMDGTGIPLNPTQRYLGKGSGRFKTIDHLVRLLYLYNRPQHEPEPANIEEYVDAHWFKVDSVRMVWTDEKRGGVPGKNDTRVRFPPTEIEWTQSMEERLRALVKDMGDNLPLENSNIEDQEIVNSWIERINSIIERIKQFNDADMQKSVNRIARVLQIEGTLDQNLLAFTNRIDEIKKKADAWLTEIRNGMQKSLNTKLSVPEDVLSELELEEHVDFDEDALKKAEERIRIKEAKAKIVAANKSQVIVADGFKPSPINTKVDNVNDMYEKFVDALQEIESIESILKQEETNAKNIASKQEAAFYEWNAIVDNFLRVLQSFVSNDIRAVKFKNVKVIQELFNFIQAYENDADLQKAFDVKEQQKYQTKLDEIELGVNDLKQTLKGVSRDFKKNIDDAKKTLTQKRAQDLANILNSVNLYLKENRDIESGLQHDSLDINYRLGQRQVVLQMYSKSNASTQEFDAFAKDYSKLVDDALKLDQTTKDAPQVINDWNTYIFNDSRNHFNTFAELFTAYNRDATNPNARSEAQNILKDFKEKIGQAKQSIDRYNRQVEADKKAEEEQTNAKQMAPTNLLEAIEKKNSDRIQEIFSTLDNQTKIQILPGLSSIVPKKIVIIGAGPNGLLTSILLRRQKPWNSVSVVEKRSAFTRKQIIIVNRAVFDVIPERVQKKLWGISKPGCFVNPPAEDYASVCYTERGDLPFASIGIDLFQKALLEEAQQSGVIVHMPENGGSSETDISAGKVQILPDEHKVVFQENTELPYDFLIGADGSNSTVRKTIIQGGEDIDQTYLAYSGVVILQFKGDAKAKVVENNGDDAPLYPAQHRSRFFASQTERAYLGISLTKEEYDEYFQNGEKMTQSIENMVDEYVEFTGYDKSNIKVESTSVFKTKLKKAKVNAIVSATDDSKFTAITGDASFNINFFAGMGFNLGMMCSIELIGMISMAMEGRALLPSVVDAYNDAVQWYANDAHDRSRGVLVPEENLDQTIDKQEVLSRLQRYVPEMDWEKLSDKERRFYYYAFSKN